MSAETRTQWKLLAITALVVAALLAFMIVNTSAHAARPASSSTAVRGIG